MICVTIQVMQKTNEHNISSDQPSTCSTDTAILDFITDSSNCSAQNSSNELQDMTSFVGDLINVSILEGTHYKNAKGWNLGTTLMG